MPKVSFQPQDYLWDLEFHRIQNVLAGQDFQENQDLPLVQENPFVLVILVDLEAQEVQNQAPPTTNTNKLRFVFATASIKLLHMIPPWVQGALAGQEIHLLQVSLVQQVHLADLQYLGILKQKWVN